MPVVRERAPRERGFAAKGLLVLVIVGVLAITIVSYTFGYVVRPGQMGVRQITFGPTQGFSSEGLSPGYHWSIPFYSKIHFIPQTIQILNLHRDRQKYRRSPGALEVQTTDGSSVDVDVTVLYHYFSGPTEKHGGPSDLLQRVGLSKDWFAHVQIAAINELKKALGRLSTSEFYKPDLREKQVTNALKEMNKRLAPDGIAVDAALLRRYTYTEQRIDRAIFEKNLQNQEERYNEAASKLAKAKADLEKVAAEWDAKIKTLRVNGDAQVRVIRSEADLYERDQRAQGDLLVAQSIAKVDRLKASSYAETKGSDVFVARELAPLLSSLKGGVVTDVDPYNLDDWVDKLGVQGGKK